jgi:hypothetical protein
MPSELNPVPLLLWTLSHVIYHVEMLRVGYTLQQMIMFDPCVESGFGGE